MDFFHLSIRVLCLHKLTKCLNGTFNFLSFNTVRHTEISFTAKRIARYKNQIVLLCLLTEYLRIRFQCLREDIKAPGNSISGKARGRPVYRRKPGEVYFPCFPSSTVPNGSRSLC